MLIKDARLEINIQDDDGWTSFHFVCFYGNNKIISLFFNSNRKVNLNIESTQEYNGYPATTTGYDI